MWVEKEGAYGNAERRTHFWHQLVNAPGEARSDLWQMMEFSKRFTTDEVWPEEILDANPELSRQDAVRRAVPQRQGRPLPGHRDRRRNTRTARPRPSASILQKGLFEEYAAFGRGHGHDLAPFDTYHEVRGLRWPVVDGKETLWRYREGLDPYVKAGQGLEFYGNPDGKARIFAVPYEPPAEVARPGIRPLAGHRPRARALAFRLDDHARARTLQGVPERASSSCTRTTPRERGLNAGREVRWSPAAARCCTRVETRGPQPAAARRGLRALVRRQPADQQGHAGRDRPDLQADGLQEMRRQDRSGLKADHRDATRWRVARGPGARLPARSTPRTRRSVHDRAARHRRRRADGRRAGAAAAAAESPTTSALMRNYPEQPPIIPHSIDNYQLTLNDQPLPDCHRRQFTEGSGAPMISVTHFMDRDGQVLGRRDAAPLLLHRLPRASRRTPSRWCRTRSRHDS